MKPSASRILLVALASALPIATAHASLPAQPKRVGPIVTVVAGSDWSLVAWRSVGGGFCYSYGAPGAAGSGCSPLPNEVLPGPLVDECAFPDHCRLVGLVSGLVSQVELRLPGRWVHRAEGVRAARL